MCEEYIVICKCSFGGIGKIRKLASSHYKSAKIMKKKMSIPSTGKMDLPMAYIMARTGQEWFL